MGRRLRAAFRLLPENAAGPGNEIMTIERILQTICTSYRLPVPGTIMFRDVGAQLKRS
jgi:hypothetical protein